MVNKWTTKILDLINLIVFWSWADLKFITMLCLANFLQYFSYFKFDLGLCYLFLREFNYLQYWLKFTPIKQSNFGKILAKPKLVVVKLGKSVMKYRILCKMLKFRDWMKIWLHLAFGQLDQSWVNNSIK